MDMFRGRANISIPFYTISVDGINIPIGLSYNTGGIKLNEVASAVGLGWSLSIPGSISKNIMGKDDDNYSIRFKNFNESSQYLNSIIDYSTNDPRISTIEQLYNGSSYDTMPDIFHYNLPTINGGFIVNNNAGYTIPHVDIKINKVNTDLFKIIDEQGNQFWISGKNFINGGTPGVAPYVNSYGIDSLQTAQGKMIKFYYAKNQSYIEKTVNENAYINLTTQTGGSYNPNGLSKYDITRSRIDYAEKLLTKIVFPEGEIIFEYSDDLELAIENNDKYRKDIGTTIGTSTIKNGLALRRIKVMNKTSETTKDFILNYSYFNPQASSDIPQDYRLKLNSVYDNLQKSFYHFTYDESIPLPRRSTANDDYWGYINRIGNLNDDHNIPRETFNPLVKIYQNGRDREVNTLYSQLGILKKITYPTGGYRNLYYENNQTKTKQYSTTIKRDEYEILENIYQDGVYGDNASEKTFSVPSTLLNSLIEPKFEFQFVNWCDNNNDNTGTIHPTSCLGSAKVITSNGSNVYTSNGKPFLNVQSATTLPITLKLYRVDECGCNINMNILHEIRNESTEIKNIGGLRILKVEDYDGKNIQNIYNYQYNGGVINQPFAYAKTVYREVPHSDGHSAPAYFQFLKLSNSSSANSSYSSSDLITYSTVTEYNGKGEIIYNFSQSNESKSASEITISDYDSWKSGLLLSQYYKKNNDTLRKEIYTYSFKPLKNSLSGYSPITNKEISFAINLDITKIKKEQGVSGNFVDAFNVQYKYINIESGKIENDTTEVIDYLNGKKIITTSRNNYYDTDITKPINLQSTENILPSGEKIKTSYQYAYEKGNQLMIDKNMITIPLETETKQTANGSTKTLSKSEIIYPKTLPSSQTGNLVLPTSVLSYNLENSSSGLTELSYDQYDSKGNIVQYTNRVGVSTVIIWGYNGTQPIVKIENAKLEGIGQSFIDNIVNASNLDAAAERNNDETNLHNAFKDFRNNLSSYQITTYSYDPLIGVRSITPPSGIREVYLYDAAGRLKEVREHNNTGKLLKEFNYHYKN
ncbi:hypothetical protein EG343_00940 [Chryseobacterium nakagawai]|uniref:YD repeat-containing protein n=1 Tax=Chryseobacterium nakagawai TaxID=1241982 RepID=A0AAD0YHT9_CHRNA|nr:hypothetical protein [Chryseobacterium nakagawai]AZA89294.1 hypothetical protein EG343_00940 [Chryseobacterium nakagawai]